MHAQEEESKDLEEELEQYERGYAHAIDEVKRKIQFRIRDITFNRGKQNPNQTSTSLQDDDRNKIKNQRNKLFAKNLRIKVKR